MIEAVLFDYGGVLSRSGQARSVERMLGEYWQVNPDQIDIGSLQTHFQSAAISSNEFFDAILAKYPDYSPVGEEVFLEMDKGLYDPAPEVYELAQKMRDHGIATGIISNVFPISAARIRQLGGYNYFHPVVLSYEVGAVKPAPEIYKEALERLNMQPMGVVLIDDQEECLAPAINLGMTTIRASSAEQIVHEATNLVRRENDLLL